jgi:hypothetical protein
MIRVQREKLIDPTQTEGIAWGLTPEGQAVLVIVAHGERILVAMSMHDARETGVGGCFASESLRQMQAAARGETRPQAMITDSRGIPLGGP